MGVLEMLAPWKSSSETSTDNGRQAPADVPAPTTGREAVNRRLAALVGGTEGGTEGRAEELRLKEVIETAPVCLIIANDVGEVLAANRSALGLFGFELPEDVILKAI